MPQFQFTDAGVTTLVSAVTAGATSVTVADSGALPATPQFVLVVDGEKMLVTAVGGGGVLTVTRGYGGTVAASHAASATVLALIVKEVYQAFAQAPRGTAFPTSPAPVEDDLFERTDRDLTYRRVGTNWLCTCPHEAFVSRSGVVLSASGAIGRIPNPGYLPTYSIFMQELWWTAWILAAPNDASNFWYGRFIEFDGATQTLLGGAVPSTANLGTARQLTITMARNAVLAATIEAFHFYWERVGAPGNLEELGAGMRFRYVG